MKFLIIDMIFSIRFLVLSLHGYSGNPKEEQIIASSSPYYIFLNEIPRDDNPSTLLVNEKGGSAFTEVSFSTSPAVGQFRVIYGGDETQPLSIGGQGIIEFNSADAGKTMEIAYYGMGSIQDRQFFSRLLTEVNENISLAELSFEVFTSNDTWTVPAGVTKANYYIIAGGGGGGGGGGNWVPTSNAKGGGGGGGGEGQRFRVSNQTVTPAANISVTVGAAGSQGTGGADGTPGADGTAGTDGGNSSIESYVAYGGKGGGLGTKATGISTPGTSGSGGASQLTGGLPGGGAGVNAGNAGDSVAYGAGGDAGTPTGTSSGGGGGGGGNEGIGGKGRGNTVGSAGVEGGGGGGGVSSTSGYDGGSGLIIVTYKRSS